MPKIGKTYSLTAPTGYKEKRTVTEIKNGRVYYNTDTSGKWSVGVKEFMRVVREFGDKDAES